MPQILAARFAAVQYHLTRSAPPLVDLDGLTQ